MRRVVIRIRVADTVDPSSALRRVAHGGCRWRHPFPAVTTPTSPGGPGRQKYRLYRRP